MQVAGCWLLVAGCWLLVAVAGFSSMSYQQRGTSNKKSFIFLSVIFLSSVVSVEEMLTGKCRTEK
jgi:hypothetical protein